MPNFETFTKRMAPLVKQPTVTIQKRGTISLNASAHAALGAPTAVELLFDRDENILGIRSVGEASPHGYPLRAQAGKDVGPFLISGRAFTQYYDIPTEVSRRWVAELEGEVLCVSLDGPSVEATSNRGGSSVKRAS